MHIHKDTIPPQLIPSTKGTLTTIEDGNLILHAYPTVQLPTCKTFHPQLEQALSGLPIEPEDASTFIRPIELPRNRPGDTHICSPLPTTSHNPGERRSRRVGADPSLHEQQPDVHKRDHHAQHRRRRDTYTKSEATTTQGDSFRAQGHMHNSCPRLRRMTESQSTERNRLGCNLRKTFRKFWKRAKAQGQFIGSAPLVGYTVPV